MVNPNKAIGSDWFDFKAIVNPLAKDKFIRELVYMANTAKIPDAIKESELVIASKTKSPQATID